MIVDTSILVAMVKGESDDHLYVDALMRAGSPRLSAAIRWNEQLFAQFPNGRGGQMRWGEEVRRLDLAPVYRFSPHVQLKLQYSIEYHQLRAREFSQWAAAQVTVRF